MYKNRRRLLLLKLCRVKCIGTGLMFFCLMSLPQWANAAEFPNLLGSPEKLSAAVAAPLIIMHDMLGERLIVEVMPAYWTASFDGGDTAGYGGALALKYELTPNWGVALLGSYGSSNEFSTTQSFLLSDQTQFVSGKYKLDYSEALALALTYDPFSEPGGFRLPIYAGAVSRKAKMSGSEKWTTDTITVVNEVTDDLNWMAGISPEFNIWKFRLQPGVTLIWYKNTTLTAKRANGTDLNGSYHTSYGRGSGDLLLGIKYVPWGLTYNFQYTVNLENLTIHSLTFSKSW